MQSAHRRAHALLLAAAVEAERLPRYLSPCAPGKPLQKGDGAESGLKDQPSFDDASVGEILRVRKDSNEIAA